MRPRRVEHRVDDDAVRPAEPVDGAPTFAIQRGIGVSVIGEMCFCEVLAAAKAHEIDVKFDRILIDFRF